MTRKTCRWKLMTLLAYSFCGSWSTTQLTTSLTADEPSQFRVSDKESSAKPLATSNHELVGPSGPIHSLPAQPRAIVTPPTEQLLRQTTPRAIGPVNSINLIGLQTGEPRSGRPAAPPATAPVPGKIVLQDLKAKPPAATPEKPELKSGSLNVLPIVPAPKDPKPVAKDLLKTDDMIGALGDSTTLFSKLGFTNSTTSKLKIPEDFRSLPAQPGANTRSQSIEPGLDTEWFNQTFTWVAPTFHHRPLYFEQPNLERYGIGTRRVAQPVVSAAHFFTSFSLVPYKLFTQHPCEKVYTLGHCRPGNVVPVQRLTLLGQSYPGEVHRYWENYSGYR